MVQKVQQRRIGVLGILDQQHHRLGLGEPFEEQPPAREQLLAAQRRVAVAGIADAEQPTKPRAHIGPLGRVGHEPGQSAGQLGRSDLQRVFLGDPETLTHDLGQRPERHPLAVGQAAATVPPHGPGESVDILLELPTQARLTHSGRPAHHYQPRRAAFGGGVEQLLHGAQLHVAPGQRRLQPVDTLRTTDTGQHPRRPPQLGRVAFALQLVLAGVGEPDRRARQPLRRTIDPHRPRFRGGLHPRRRVHRIAGHHPLRARPQRDRYLPGHDTRAQGQARGVDVGA